MPFLGNIKLPELIIILVIIILLFGVGRVTKIGEELGGAIKSFRKGIKDDDKDVNNVEDKDKTGKE
jgi:sec-independent protein translocase protein TatA